MYKLSMYYAMVKKKQHRTEGPMPVKDILKEVKKKKRLMHNAARDMDESGIEAAKRSRKRQCHP